MDSSSQTKTKQKISPFLFRSIWIATICICIGFLYLAYQRFQLQREFHESPDIFVSQGDMGFSLMSSIESPREQHDERNRGLKPNLQNIQMIVPNRPHNPEELHQQEKKQKFLRRKTFLISTDSYGFRKSDTFQKTRHDTKNSILVVGDSKSFGWGVNYQDSYVYHLERELRVEILNASVPGAISIDAALKTKEYVQQFQPSLILFHFRPTYYDKNAVMDFVNAIKKMQSDIGNTKIILVLPPLSTFDILIPDIEAFYEKKNFLEMELELLTKKLPNMTIIDTSSVFRNKQKSDIEKLSNSKETLVLFREEDGIQYLQSQQQTIIAQAPAPSKPWFSFLARQPVDVFADDILQKFEEDLSMREPYFLDGAHPDEKGNLLFAKIVAQKMKDIRWVPSQRGGYVK